MTLTERTVVVVTVLAMVFVCLWVPVSVRSNYETWLGPGGDMDFRTRIVQPTWPGLLEVNRWTWLGQGWVIDHEIDDKTEFAEGVEPGTVPMTWEATRWDLVAFEELAILLVCGAVLLLLRRQSAWRAAGVQRTRLATVTLACALLLPLTFVPVLLYERVDGEGWNAQTEGSGGGGWKPEIEYPEGFIDRAKTCAWVFNWSTWQPYTGTTAGGQLFQVESRIYWPVVLLEQGIILLIGGGLLTAVARRERRRKALSGSGAES